MQELLTIRSYGDTAEPWLFPSLDAGGALSTEDGDGTPVVMRAKNVRLEREGRKGWEPVLKHLPSASEVYVTGSRLVAVCRDYNKGGGWVGGGSLVSHALAAGVNAVSKSRARGEIAGSAFALQIRYLWMRQVASMPPGNFLDDAHLVFAMKDGESTWWRLILDVERSEPVGCIATDIAQRVGAYCAAIGTRAFNESMTEGYVELANLTPDGSEPQETRHEMPGAFLVPSGELAGWRDEHELASALKRGDHFLDEGVDRVINHRAATTFGSALRRVTGDKPVRLFISAQASDGGYPFDAAIGSTSDEIYLLWQASGEIRHEVWMPGMGGASVAAGRLPHSRDTVMVMTVGLWQVSVPSMALTSAFERLLNNGKE